MLFASQTGQMVDTFGLEEGLSKMMDAGFPALDLTVFSNYEYMFSENWRERADDLLNMVQKRGAVFHQAHAPFGGGYDYYTTTLVPQIPQVMAFVGRLGAKQIIVHPLQRGRYYGHERELFDLNMNFYRSLAPYAKEYGVRIAIENMWQTHPVNHHICDDVCADPKELIAYHDTLDDPEAFTICLDLGHVALCGREPEDAIRTIGHDRLGALHVHDVDCVNDLHTLPGQGSIHWQQVCQALADIDYSGCFTLESDGFIYRYEKAFRPIACKFMADIARHYADMVDARRK